MDVFSFFFKYPMQRYYILMLHDLSCGSDPPHTVCLDLGGTGNHGAWWEDGKREKIKSIGTGLTHTDTKGFRDARSKVTCLLHKPCNSLPWEFLCFPLLSTLSFTANKRVAFRPLGIIDLSVSSVQLGNEVEGGSLIRY